MDATCWHLRHVAVGINALSRKVAVDEALIWQTSDRHRLLHKYFSNMQLLPS